MRGADYGVDASGVRPIDEKTCPTIGKNRYVGEKKEADERRRGTGQRREGRQKRRYPFWERWSKKGHTIRLVTD